MEIKGQITTNNPLGDLLATLASCKDFKNFVEIGTWKGQGSTKCITEQLLHRADESVLFSIELNEEFYKEAVEYWMPLIAPYGREKLKLFLGRIVETEDIPPWDEISLWLENNNLSNQKDDYHRWRRETKDCFKENIIKNVINKLPKEIDVLLLDGGEITSYGEFKRLEDRVKIVILDDIYVFKNFKVHNELLKSKDWDLFFTSPIRHGVSAFCKKEIRGAISDLCI